MSSEDEDMDVGDYEPNLNDEDQERQRQEELNRKFPNRPINNNGTLPFHVLYQDLFEPLIHHQKRKAPTHPTGRRAGPHGGPSNNPREIRRDIIERFFSRWRREVGNDVFPAMRLIIPEKDRERAMYGLKEKALARYLVKLMKIDKNSEDGFNLLNWKLPGQSAAARSAGDFAGRCYDVLCKRAHRIEPGNMSVQEVNEQLDLLSKDAKEEHQLPVLEVFYKNMNADEMTWLIRIILRNMKIGATERTILGVWHPDAEALFNVSSSLRRVCWELYSTNIRLEGTECSVKLGECFQPELASQINTSFTHMVTSMKPTEDDPEFWIEEKMDGERMQVHVSSDPDKPGNKRFRFWSRHAKDYTYLYGDSFENPESALTKYIKDGFHEGVEDAILDGEMVTWNVHEDMIAAFGTLKTAANVARKNSQNNERPFFRIFDILYLNGQPLTRYTLRDRRKALEATINNVHRYMEILPYSIGTSANDIERCLRDVIVRASEGLVLKNPRSAYIVGDRNHDWIKVKPEYMTEFGQSLDCLVIGGYYGSGHRGGNLSSFLCGLREDGPRGKKIQKFLSFFKVGGGMTTDDFAKLRHNTEGKWQKYDPANPPTEYIVLGGGQKQTERPDMWIKPEDSIVVEVKAASVNQSDDYAMDVTLRFPRFTRFRQDKDWQSALSVEEFYNVKSQAELKAEENKKEAKLQMSKKRQKTQRTNKNKSVLVAGYDAKSVNEITYDGAKTDVFRGLAFYIMTESIKPEKKSKFELERMVKENGGVIVQSAEVKHKDKNDPELEIVCVAERRTVKVASLEKRGKKEIIRPIWLFDCIKQGKIDFAKGRTEIQLPFEIDRHLFSLAEEKKPAYEGQVDRYGDSYARDTSKEELRSLMAGMANLKVNHSRIEKRDLLDPGDCRGWMFADLVIWFDDTSSETDDVSNRASNTDEEARRISAAKATARFAGAKIADKFDDESVSHIVVNGNSDKTRIRKEIATRKKLPRIVFLDWVEECWKERTRIDEERFAVV